ncbi:MAG: FecR family protein [Candidatus Limnocylindria bacterium]
MKKALVVLLVLVVAVAAFLYFPRTSIAQAADNAVLAVLNAGVFAQRTGDPEFVSALDGEVFASGDLVRADAEGRAVLTFFDGSTLSVEPSSDVRVVSLVKTSSGGIQLTIEQTIGRTWASVSDLATPDSRFEIKTPSMTAIVRGTAFETIVEKQPDGTTKTTVKTGEGEVLVQAEAGGEVSVGAGQQVEVKQNEPAPAQPEPQPPTPKLRFAAPAGVGFVVIDPRGLRCGATGTATERQIPRCDVAGDGGQRVVIGDVVGGGYTVLISAAQETSGAFTVEGVGVSGTDFTHPLALSLSTGDLLRTELDLTVEGGKLASAGLTAVERLTSVCGAETQGRVFSGGDVEERFDLLVQFSAASKDQPAAFVVTGAEMTDAVTEALETDSANIPVTVSSVAVAFDPAGLHLSAVVTAGPLTVPARADLIGGSVDGRLVLKLRHLDVGIVPDAAKEQIATALQQVFADLTEDFPLVVQRVSFRSGCMAVIGRTP